MAAQRAHRLILGGARSGKSARAQALAEAAGPRRTYVATARALDTEMAARIAMHQADRGDGWDTVEEPLELNAAVTARQTDVIVIDCLTLWLSNLMHEGHDVVDETEALIAALTIAWQPVIMVSNEVGLSLVPETALGRAFRDAQGLLNQRIAAVVPHVEFVAAGLPLTLKG